MNHLENRTLDEFLSDYSNGERHFQYYDFEEDGSVKGLDLSDVVFEDCFLFLDFRNAKLTNSKFIRCNIKTADFSDADLSNAMIKNCMVESILLNRAKVDNLIFEENYYYGLILNQNDLHNLIEI